MSCENAYTIFWQFAVGGDGAGTMAAADATK